MSQLPKIIIKFIHLQIFKNKNLYYYYTQKKAIKNVFRKIYLLNFGGEKAENWEIILFWAILLGKSLNLNPYDQPSIELIKKQLKIFYYRNEKVYFDIPYFFRVF